MSGSVIELYLLKHKLVGVESKRLKIKVEKNHADQLEG